MSIRRSKGLRQGNYDPVKDKTIVTRIGKVILTRQIENCNKDRRSDIGKEQRQGEEYQRR